MYFLNEKKTKLIICSLLIVLSVSTLLIGRTLVNTLIVSTYPVTILPYFYLVQAVLLMITTAVISGYQNKYPKRFTIIFKGIAVISLLIFSVALKSNLPVVPFVISIAILTFTSIISDIPWNYAAQIFDMQEYKRFSKLLQVSGTFSVIVTGAMITFLSAKLGLSALLPVMAFIEFVSIFFILLVSKYVSTLAVSKNQPNFSSIVNKTSIFKYLALFTVVAVIVSTLIDYNFKLSLSTEIEKQKIIGVVTTVFVISTAGTLIVQVFLLDYSLRVLGSKKIIIIFPLILLITAFTALLSPAFSFVALLAIINDMFFYSTWSLSKNLYLNTLASSIKNLGLLKLSGIIKPISVGLGSIIIFILTPYNDPRLSIALVIVSCVYMLYLSRILIKEYSTQLAKSIYLRRFHPELINAADKNRQEIESAISQALDDNTLEAKLFALQLLASNKNLHLPKSIKPLLLTKNVGLLKETARVLTIMHPNQHEFVAEATDAFSKSRDIQVRWYLVLYLIEMRQNNLLSWAHQLIKSKICASLAIGCLIYMKQGNLEQQTIAMNHLIKMLHSHSEEQQKWLLIILKELPHINIEEYLIKFINEGPPAIQILALQQASNAASQQLLNTLIEHLGESAIAHSLHNSLIEIGEQVIDLLEAKIKQATSYQIITSCILILTKIRGIKAEIALINILSDTNDVVIKTVLAKYLAYRGVKNKISETMRSFLSKEIRLEVDFYVQLSNQSFHYTHSLIIAEINSRIQFIKRRVLYYLASLSGSIDLLNSIPLLTSVNPNKNEQARALELIDSKIEDRTISSLLMGLFTETKPKTIIDNSLADPWLQEFIHKVESNNMESIYKLTRLRRIDLFRNLTAETLQVLAECCASKDMAKDEVIFNEGDLGDGLYIIDSGGVIVTKQEKVLANLSEGAYFGELALLADTPRFATVTAASEGALFYIDKQDFDRVTDEIPEIMKSITRQVISYFAVLATNY